MRNNILKNIEISLLERKEKMKKIDNSLTYIKLAIFVMLFGFSLNIAMIWYVIEEITKVL